MACSYKTKVMILSLLMILVLLTTWTAAPFSYSRAVLAELTVTGEVVMTLAALASLMMIAFGASGMDGAVRNQAAATGTQPLTYVGQLLNRWLSSGASNLGFSTLATKMQEGLSYLPDGTLYLDSEATAAVADFQRWAWDEDGANLEQFAVIGTSDGNLHGGGYTAYVYDADMLITNSAGLTAYYDDQFVLSNGPNVLDTIALVGQSGRYYAVIINGYPGYQRYSLFVNVPVAEVREVGVSLRNMTTFTTTKTVTTTPGVWTFVVAADNLWSDVPIAAQAYTGALPDIGDMVGDSAVIGDVDTFVGPMQQEQGTQLPLSGAVTVSADAAARLHLDNYLRAVAAAYAGSGTASVPVTDVGTGDEDTLPLSVPLDNPIGVTGVTDAAIDQSGSVAGSDAVASDFEGLDDYTMDLTQFFPFCVPFDLAYLFDKLRADPEALVIDWHFLIPYLDVDIPIQIDLSPFDSLAQLLRSLEVIAFIVALLVGTKNLIQGGD